MKILLVSLYYAPETNFVTADIARFFAAAGDQVTVVTAYPNYPHGRFFEGSFSLWPRKFCEGNVTVWRLPHYPYHGLSKVRRLLSYMSHTALCAVLAPWLGRRPDVVIVYQTPFTSALGALWFKLLGCLLLYVNADLWPESFAGANVKPHKYLMGALYRYSRWINRFADHMVVTTRGMSARYAQDGFPVERMSFVPLWVDGAGLPLPPTQQRQLGAFRLVYAGNLGAAQDLSVLLRAVWQLQQAGLTFRTEIYGTGVEDKRLRELAAGLNLADFHFMGRVSPDEVFAACAVASATLIHLVDSPQFKTTIPSKLAFSLSAGAPIICGAPGETAKVVEESGAGYVFEPGSVDELAGAIRAMMALGPEKRRQMGDLGRRYYLDFFEKRTLLERYGGIVRQLVATRPRRGVVRRDHLV